ncbi:hypothetical protein N2152v2_008026 [Parachlorella kessleri]
MQSLAVVPLFLRVVLLLDHLLMSRRSLHNIFVLREPASALARCQTLDRRGGHLRGGFDLINVKTEAACPDWFSPGSPNDLYTAALGSFFLDGTTPSFACRQVASTVHTLELIGPQDGSNFLFDDPRKVSQAVADMRTINVDNRVSLVLWYQYTVASPDVGQNIFATLDENVRNGNFLNAVVSNGADAAAPLLEAVTFQQLYSGGVGCVAPQ